MIVLSPLSAAVAVDARRRIFAELETKGAHGMISTATANAHREKHGVMAGQVARLPTLAARAPHFRTGVDQVVLPRCNMIRTILALFAHLAIARAFAPQELVARTIHLSRATPVRGRRGHAGVGCALYAGVLADAQLYRQPSKHVYEYDIF